MPRKLTPRWEENRKRLGHVSQEFLPPREIRDAAACATGVGAQLNFFSRDPAMKAACISLCESCPVRRECLEWALSTLQCDGIWGGRTDMEIRRALSVDQYGRYRYMLRDVRCPDCRTRELVISTKRYKCTSCELEWPRIAPRRGQAPPPWFTRALEKAIAMQRVMDAENAAAPEIGEESQEPQERSG